MKYIIIAFLFVNLSFSQKVKIKNDKIIIDDKEVFICKKENFNGASLTIYDLKTNEELIFIKENNGGTRGADSRHDDYTVYKFIKENVTVEMATYNFMSSNVKFLYKNEIFDENGKINEKKVLEFKEKYDEKISEKTVIIR